MTLLLFPLCVRCQCSSSFASDVFHDNTLYSSYLSLLCLLATHGHAFKACDPSQNTIATAPLSLIRSSFGWYHLLSHACGFALPQDLTPTLHTSTQSTGSQVAVVSLFLFLFLCLSVCEHAGDDTHSEHSFSLIFFFIVARYRCDTGRSIVRVMKRVREPCGHGNSRRRMGKSEKSSKKTTQQG